MASSLRGVGLLLIGIVIGMIIGVWWLAPRLNGTIIRFESATNPIASPSVPTITPNQAPMPSATSPASPSNSASPTPSATIQATASLTSSGDLKLDLLAAVNRERQQTNCEALVFDSRLQSIAQAHADDMAQHEKIDHVGSDGRSYSQRLEAVGY